jgi:Mg-chelatase subunit ChlD
MILRNPQLLWLVLPLLLMLLFVGRRGGMRKASIVLHSLLVVLLVVALADPLRPGTAAPPGLLVLVDASASMPAERVQEAWQTALRIASSHGPEHTTLAAFGRNVAVATGSEMPTVDNSASDIAGALRLAGGLLGGSGRVLLLSDGAATTAGAERVAVELRAAGIAVDTLALPADERPDARVAEIAVPAGLREGQSYRGEVIIVASAAMTATLRFGQEGEPGSEQPIQLRAGRNSIPFSATAGRSGVHRYSAALQVTDAHVENNALERAVVVGPAPHVLVIERVPEGAARIRDMLEQGGVQSEARRPADLSSTLSELQRFDAIVLQDVPADDLSLDQQATLREYVRATGRGLLALGGTNSYGLGNYKGTPLEDVLPVDMQPPPRRERQSVALLLIVDRSASMYGADPRTSKLEMAKGAAIAATQSLMPGDRVGVLVFDTSTDWIVPFTTIGDGRSLAQIQDDIARLQFGGGTDIYSALAEGLPELMAQTSATAAKHAVLLTDGRSYADDQGYEQLIAAARQAGATLSSIAIGDDADTDLLKRLAERGAGRYHFAADPQDLPRLTLKETEIAREDPRVEGELQPQPHMLADGEAHPTMRGFVPRRIPNVGGYVGTTLKPTADLILESPDGDTILAGWQYGLGRALAWTSDSGERWADDWQTWADSPTFWTQVLSYTFPDPSTGPLQARIETDALGPRVVAEATDTSGTPLDLADVAVRLDDPAGTETTVRLKQVAPGRYEARLPDAQMAKPGAYRFSAVLQKGEQRLETLAGWSQPYAAEFAGTGSDPGLLRRVAEASGGTVLTSPEHASAVAQAPPARDPLVLWPWFAGLALLIWLCEIAIRRGWILRPKGS